jgi:hypothetical protein
MRARLLAALAVAGIALACEIVLIGDMEVRWTLDAPCGDYNVAQFEVTALGPERESTIVSCGGDTSFTTGNRFYGIVEGNYSVTIKALSGSGQVLATKSDSGPVLSDAGPSIVILKFKASDFSGPIDCGNGICEDGKGETCTSCPSDCGACGLAKLNVYWNINGTTDGTPKGPSWDKCAEVGAAYAAVNFDGTDHYVPCDKDNMAGLVNVSEGSHTISVALTDSSKTKITTETAAKTLSCTLAKSCELVVDFFWDSFLSLKNTQKGDFIFTTSFDGGKSCSEVTPKVTLQTSLLYLSGSAVNPAPEACGPNDVCYKMDGAATSECWGPKEKQKIKDYAWGEYQITIRGLIDGGNICYDAKDKKDNKKIDILIGAGTVNPTVEFDLVRDAASPACQ